MDKINKLQITRERFDQANLANSRHIYNLWDGKPDMIKHMLDVVFTSRNTPDGSYSIDSTFKAGNMISRYFGIDEIEYVTGFECDWKIRKEGYRALNVISGPSSTTNIGRNGAPFEIVFDSNICVPGELIGTGEFTPQQARIKTIEQEGENYKYTLEIYSGDETTTISADKLAAGAQWLKVGGYPRGEAGSGGSSIVNYTCPRFRNTANIYSVETKLTDIGANLIYKIKMENKDGEYLNMWMYDYQMEHLKELQQTLAYQFLYSRTSNAVRYNEEGEKIMPSMGLIEQIENGGHNVKFHNFSLDMLEEALETLAEGRLEPGEANEFLLFTGRQGFKNFSRAIDRKIQQTGVEKNTNPFIKESSGDIGKRGLSYGQFYREWYPDMGGVVKCVYLPYSDYKTWTLERNPISGTLAASERMILLNASGKVPRVNGGVKQNIKQIKIDGLDNTYFQRGQMPMPRGMKEYPVTLKSAYSVFTGVGTIGCAIIDPSLTMQFVPQI